VIGQLAEVRILAFKQRTTKPLKGQFAFVSADKLIDKNSGEPYFRAHIKVNKSEAQQIAGRKLIPGMPAEIIIKTGSRTALDYIIDPVLASMNRAWRED
jgi:multidrug efflux pump subunit AcrA (membrane-fusion protein)